MKNGKTLALKTLTVALAMAGLSCSASAQDRPEILVLKPIQPAEARKSDPFSFAAPREASPVASELPRSPFHIRLLAGAASIKSNTRVHEWQSGVLTLRHMRVKSAPKPDGLAPFTYGRFAAWNLDAGLTQDLTDRDSVSLGLSFALEKHRPSLITANHKTYRTSDVAIMLGWAHDNRFSLSASLFSTKPNGARPWPVRVVERAGGAPLAASGLALTANFNPSGEPQQMVFGIDLRRQKLGHHDASLIGTAAGLTDTRAVITLSETF